MARALALAAALAVSLLAVSGAGGSARRRRSAAARRHRPVAAEPPCLNVVPGECDVHGSSSGSRMRCSPGAFERRPATSRCGRASSRTSTSRRSRRSRSRTTSAPRRAGATACRSPPRDFVFTHKAILKYARRASADTHVQRRVVAPSTRRRSVVLRSRFADWRAALRPRPAAACARGRGPRRVSGRDGIDNPKTGSPIGSGPFLVERWERGRQLIARSQPALLGAARRLSRPASSSASAGPCGHVGAARCSNRFAAAQADIALNSRHRHRVRPASDSGIRVTRRRRSAGSTSLSASAPGGHPALATRTASSSVGRSPTGSTASRSSARCSATSTPDYQAERQRRLPEHEPLLPAELEGYRYRPRSPRRLLEQAGCRRGRRRHLRLRRRAPLASSSDDGRRSRLRSAGSSSCSPSSGESGIEVRADLRSGRALFSQILPSGDFDVASSRGLSAWRSRRQ